MNIQRLSDIVISQIAAGEVIERPASVVKELVENALDAGATSIQVSSTQGGRRLIRVSDNGSGIRSNEVALALTRHATSKLRTTDDLNQLVTLGFRGEALSSIAAVSRITLTTRHRDEKIGTEIRLEGGALIRHQPAGAPTGTVISVEDLFFNTPARLKFLKKEATEKRYISTIITRYAMAYPSIRFLYIQDEREVFRTSGSGQLADVIVKSFGIDTFRQMLEVNSMETPRNHRPEIHVHGYTTQSSLNRGDRNQIALFINGRWIQDSRLTYAIVQAYHNLIAPNRYPITVLMVNMPTDELDVNVHPTKAEVRFRQPDHVFAAIQRAVRETIMNAQAAGDTRFQSVDITQQIPPGGANNIWHSNVQLNLDLADDTAPRSISQQDERFEADIAIPSGPDKPRKPRSLPPLRVIGQVGAMYIVAEGPAGMYLIDQNSAHTRVLYEALLEDYTRDEVVTQTLQTGETIEVTAGSAQTIEQYLILLKRLGILLEPFGPTTFRIQSVPHILVNTSRRLQVTIQAILEQIPITSTPEESTATLAQAIAQQAAIRSGQILSPEQMTDIIRKLERCEQPHNAPDGRATLIHLTGDQLAREFARGT